MTITREQIEVYRSDGTNRVRLSSQYGPAHAVGYVGGEALVDLCDLALEALANRSDAKLGAKVRAELPEMPGLADACDKTADNPGSSWAHATIHSVFHAISTALREESDHG